MAFANWKVAIFYVVNGAALELQFARKSCVHNYVAILSAWKYWNFERGKFTHQYWWYAFVFRIAALEYWCLGVSLLNRIFIDFQLMPNSVCLWRKCYFFFDMKLCLLKIAIRREKFDKKVSVKWGRLRDRFIRSTIGLIFSDVTGCTNLCAVLFFRYNWCAENFHFMEENTNWVLKFYPKEMKNRT